MSFPNTPNTIIGKLIDKDSTHAEQLLWIKFLDIYHKPIKSMVLKSFSIRNWHNVPDDYVETLITNSVLGVKKSFENNKSSDRGFILGKSKFRFYLKRIVENKVVDFMRANRDISKTVSLETIENFDFVKENTLDDKEEEDLKYALMYDTYDSIREKIDPIHILAFEKVVFEGKKVATVADELGITCTQVSDYKYRVIKKLIAEIEKVETGKAF